MALSDSLGALGPIAAQAPYALPAAANAIRGAIGPTGNPGALAAAQASFGANPIPTPGAQDLSRFNLNPADMTGGGAADVASKGKIASLLSFQPASLWGGAAPAVEGGGITAAGGALGAGSLGRGGLYAAGGVIGGNLLRGAIGQRDGVWDDAAVDAVKGAGIGAGFGSVVPGVGTAIGAGAGGIIGGVYGALTGGDSDQTNANRYIAKQLDPSYNKGLASILLASGVSQTLAGQVMAQYQGLSAQVSTEKDAKALTSNIVQSIPQLIAQDQQTAAVAQQQQTQQAQSAAIQSYLAPLIKQQVASYNQSAQEASALQTSAANVPGIDPQLAAIYKAHAANMLTDSRQQGLAYLSQVAAAPALYGNPGYTDPTSVIGANATTLPANQSVAYQQAYALAQAKAAGTAAGKPAKTATTGTNAAASVYTP